MKFPKSLHAEGWGDHIDSTKSNKSVASAPLHAAKAAPTGMGMSTPPRVAPSMSTTPPIATPRVDPLAGAARPHVAALPPQRENRLSWMIGAGAGAAILAALAVWAMNRPADVTAVPPAVLTGSTVPQTEVAAATPLVEPAPAASQEDAAAVATATAMAAAPVRAEPATPVVGLPVTTSRPAPETRTVAQAPVPAPRPDMVVRAAPGSTASLPPATPYLQPRTPIAAAPATDAQPLSVSPGTEPIVLPPTAAGPIALTTPQTVQAQPATTPETVTQPVAAAAPDTATGSTAPGTPPLAQAAPQQPQPQVQPAPEDTGITVQVRMALAADSTLSAVPIAVSTDRGVVKLEGQAPDASTRERATVVAASATGVKAVDNRLIVAPTTQVSQAPVNLQ